MSTILLVLSLLSLSAVKAFAPRNSSLKTDTPKDYRDIRDMIRNIFLRRPWRDQGGQAPVTSDYHLLGTDPSNSTDTDVDSDDCLGFLGQLFHVAGQPVNFSKVHISPGMTRSCNVLRNFGVNFESEGDLRVSIPPTPTSNSNDTGTVLTHGGHDSGEESESDSYGGTTVLESDPGMLQKLKDMFGGGQHDDINPRFIQKVQEFLTSKFHRPPFGDYD